MNWISGLLTGNIWNRWANHIFHFKLCRSPHIHHYRYKLMFTILLRSPALTLNKRFCASDRREELNFHEKLLLVFPYFSQKNRFSIKILLLCPYFLKKTSILRKTRRSHVYFFKYFIKNPMLSCPNLVKRTSILS